MSTSMAIRHQTFLAEGKVRVIIVMVLLALAFAFAFLPQVPDAAKFNTWMAARIPIIHGTVLAVLAAFIAALLTIWTLMKTRSTRYIERLADSRTFAEFIGDFEGRLLVGAATLLLTSVVAIAGWTPSMTWSFDTAINFVWAGACAASLILLIDSLLTARVLL